MALTPGTRLSVYEIITPIGEGGMGLVNAFIEEVMPPITLVVNWTAPNSRAKRVGGFR